jgi:hypothetical protein
MVKKKTSDKQDVSSESKESKKSKFNFSKLNYWMIASIVLAIVLLAVVFVNSFNSISSKEAGNKAVELAGMSGLELTVDGVDDLGSFYSVNYTIQGQNGIIHITKDGRYVGQMSEFPKKSDITGDAVADVPVEVPKSDNPGVELYVWSYCPYGVQAQGPVAQVAQLLKANADFEIVPYYDGHGAYETQQNKIQLCIQKLAKDKYWSYAAKFVSDVYPKCSSARTEDCDKTESIKVMKAVGIDSTKVMSCVSTDGDALFAAASAKAQQNGVQGSPTITINGVIVNVARTSEAIKTAICDAFNTAPSACSTTLDSSAAAAAGNC